MNCLILLLFFVVENVLTGENSECVSDGCNEEKWGDFLDPLRNLLNEKERENESLRRQLLESQRDSNQWSVVLRGKAGEYVPAEKFDEIVELGKSGCDFKLGFEGVGVLWSIWKVDRFIVSNEENIWVYVIRESSSGSHHTFGMNISKGGRENGAYWIGDPVDVKSLNSFFGGTSGGRGSGSVDFTLFIKR